MKKTLLSLFMVSVSFAVVGEEARYTMDDLKALNGSKNWNELLAHAEAIRPSQRNSEWESLVQNAALGAFEHYVASGAKDDAIGLGQQLILSYPFLSQSKSFTQQFSKELVPAAQPCIQYAIEGCVENYGQLLNTLAPSAEVSYEEGTKVFQNVSKSLSVPFLQQQCSKLRTTVQMKTSQMRCSTPWTDQIIPTSLWRKRLLHKGVLTPH